MNKEIHNEVEYKNEKKKIINNWFELQLDSKYITDLIIEINDKSYIKKCIKNREKLNLGSSCVVKLIKKINNVKYIKRCVKKKDELRLASYHLSKLIKATNDKNYIIKCINKRSKLKLSSYYVAELIKFTNDKEYIIDCIENCKKLNLDSYIITKLIEFLEDEEYTKRSICNATDLGLTKEDITYLIKSTGEDKYIKKYIDSKINQELDSKNIVDLIINTENQEYIKFCIKNSERLKLKSADLTNLILLTQDREYITKYIYNKYIFKLGDINVLKNAINKNCVINKIKNECIIDLPENMTIGIEIETVGRYSDRIKKSAINLENWEIKQDDSIKEDISGENGIEIISPILDETNERNTEQIVRILKILKTIGQHTNDSCGGHIHIGCNYLKNVRSYINLIEIWGNAEYIFYVIGNKEGSTPRGIEYSSPISKIWEKYSIKKDISLEQIKKEIVKLQGTRAKGINFINILPNTKGTIEFRLSNGTIEPDVWIQNINLYGNILVAAQKLSEIQEKCVKKRTEHEKNFLNDFEKLKLEKKNKKKLEILLNILIKDESIKDVYRNRYSTNVKLLQNKKKLNHLLKSKITKKGINLKK